MSSISKYIATFCLLLTLTLGYGQLPKSDLYLLDIDTEQNVSKITYLNAYNSNGYNNQPSFKDDNNLFVVSNLNGADQTDIILLNLSSGRMKRLTHTTESEFSPKLYRNTEFTVVKVLKNGKQVIWEYPFSLEDNGQTLFSMDKNIGYYHSLPNFKIAMYSIESTDTNTLQIGNLRRQSHRMIDSNIGRCFVRTNDGNILFVSKDSPFLIKKYNASNGQITVMAQMAHSVEDFFLYNNRICYGYKSKIYMYDNSDEKWLEWFDLQKLGINHITRVACRNNKIVLVNKKS